MAPVIAAAVLAASQNASATAVFYSDRAAFNAAGGNVLNFDSFEDAPGPSQSHSRSGYTMAENGSGTTLELRATCCSNLALNGLGNANTDGTWAIIYGNSGGSILTFVFDVPINGFGFDFTPTIDVPTVTVGGDVSSSFSATANTPSFFGVIDGMGTFQTLTFVTNGTPANVAYDSVSFGTVPEAGVPLLIATGLVGLAVRRRRLH
jgi:hypothetical protein